MKKSKSLSNWMSSALKKPPISTTSVSSQSSHDTAVGSGGTVAVTRQKLTGKKLVKHNSSTSTVGSVEDADMPWCQKHSPVSVGDLAVHKKKVAEVQQWLEYALSTGDSRLMLLLVGPPGCGKTATIHTLAREIGCLILEWANPVTDVGGSEADPQPGDLVVYAESQTKQFRSFLLRANRYPSLLVGGASGCGLGASGCGLNKKIVIVEDFPNAFLRDPHKFHEILRSVCAFLRHPLVFIVSESHQRDSSTHTLFSKTHNLIDIHTISFNPVAHTAMVKTLLRIADSECGSGTASKSRRVGRERHYQQPSREVVEQLAESSVGDIRSAINALQFTCRTGKGVVEVKGQRSVRVKRNRAGSSSGVKMKRYDSSDGRPLAAVGGRDNSLFLFRALGKILYCKRATAVDQGEGEGEGEGEAGVTPPLPPHLQLHERPRLLVNPEWVMEHSHLSSELFTLYLHQNYLNMYNEIENVVCASEYLSASDVISTLWTDSQPTRASLQSASCSLACRGLMHSSDYVPGGGGSKWRPLHKPQWTSVGRTYHENCRTAKRLFLHLGQSPHAHLWTPVEMQTEILPHLALTNVPLRNPDQAALLQSITHFSHGHIRSRVERLGERDVETALTQEDTSSLTTGQLNRQQQLSQEGGVGGPHSVSQDVGRGLVDGVDEETEIEDFEDDMIW